MDGNEPEMITGVLLQIKWEYCTVTGPQMDEVTTLNALGADGWEAYGVYCEEGRSVHYLKRTVTERVEHDG